MSPLLAQAVQLKAVNEGNTLCPPFCSLFGISSVLSAVKEAVLPSDPGDLGNG